MSKTFEASPSNRPGSIVGGDYTPPRGAETLYWWIFKHNSHLGAGAKALA